MARRDFFALHHHPAPTVNPEPLVAATTTGSMGRGIVHRANTIHYMKRYEKYVRCNASTIAGSEGGRSGG
eukprot:scaffold4730_cov109-Isochrysis_galbana.AAC.6